MRIKNFLRFTETMKVKQEKRVVSVTVRPVLSDCMGALYITDLQLQEGNKLTGYTPHTETMLRVPSSSPRYHNGVVRSGAIIILPVYGETSTALDCRIYPNQPMAPGTVELAKGVGSHRMVFLEAARPGDAFALLASERQCLKNSIPTPKHGFYQYTAAHDSKHLVTVEKGKSARVYFEYHEKQEGAPRP
jgi:hypothetical protein